MVGAMSQGEVKIGRLVLGDVGSVHCDDGTIMGFDPDETHPAIERDLPEAALVDLASSYSDATVLLGQVDDGDRVRAELTEGRLWRILPLLTAPKLSMHC